jgi:hypothetical protein
MKDVNEFFDANLRESDGSTVRTHSIYSQSDGLMKVLAAKSEPRKSARSKASHVSASTAHFLEELEAFVSPFSSSLLPYPHVTYKICLQARP